MTVTVITLLKRREGMSKEDFIDYYETHHRLIGEKVLGGYATRYVRRFLHPRDGTDQAHDFDVVLEIDFPDQATLDHWSAMVADPAVLDEIIADEEKLFDRTRIRTFTLEERASKMG